MNCRALAFTVVMSMTLASESEAQPKPLPDLPDYVFAVPPEEENLDVLYFGEASPILVRFQIRVNNRGFRTNWDQFLTLIYQYADANGDGILTEAEAGRQSWNQLLANPFGGIGGNTAQPPQGDGKTVLEPKLGKISVENFRNYVRDGLGYGPLQSQFNLASEPVDSLAFKQIDADQDGVLSTAEMTSAEALIRRLDLDEDEMVDSGELDPHRNPFAGFFMVQEGSVASDPLIGPFVSLVTTEARSKAARRLLSRYDGIDSSTRDDRLSRVESGMTFEAFRLADHNRDSRLDLVEIEQFLESPSPTIVLVLRLAKMTGQGVTLRVPTASESTASPDSRLAAKPEGSMTVHLDGREILLSGNDAVSDFRPFFNQQFTMADANKDDSVDRAEAMTFPFFANLLNLVDRNLDGKVSKAELTLYLDRSLDLGQSRTMLGIMDMGRSFFVILDGDKDGRLSRRELREVGKRLKPFDKDGDGRIRFDEIPNTFRIAVGRGQIAVNQRGFNFDTYDTPVPVRPGASGPDVAWFRRMDRNRDGDVSPREFLGSLEDFRKIDKDGDGLIDAKEAANGP